MAERFIPAVKISEVPSGKVKACRLGELKLVLCNFNGEFYALMDQCSHDEAKLSEGFLDDCAIECPRHGAKFDVRTGEVLSMPAAYPVQSFETKVEGDTIFVKVNVHE